MFSADVTLHVAEYEFHTVLETDKLSRSLDDLRSGFLPPVNYPDLAGRADTHR
jgi:hypothetical protein